MGVESIQVTSPQPDIQKMLDNVKAELKADIAKVSEDVKIIKANTEKEL